MGGDEKSFSLLDSDSSSLTNSPQRQAYETFPLMNPVEGEEPSPSRRRSSVLVAMVCILATISVVASLSAYQTEIGNKSSAEHADSESSGRKKSPNFVFILADDLSWNSMGYMGYDLAFVTPTLSRLAEHGVIITNYYAQELCTPSRAALLTGRYPINVGMQYGEVLPNQEWGLSLNEFLLPEALKEAGYINYAIGKWNLGHYSSQYLPTARGFHHFLGFLGAESYYWSKYTMNENANIKDLMLSDSECYRQYLGSDADSYSTFLYENKTVEAIQAHDFQEHPMFLYFASQAVHDPFIDSHIDAYQQGIPSEYVEAEVYEKITSQVEGVVRQQYAMALYLLDRAVDRIVQTLSTVGQLDNTYIIFSSDNGGCAGAGGANGPLRGSKGSLFEGGTKVNAFVFSPLLRPMVASSPSSSGESSNSIATGIQYSYDGLMHISDWFPTILELASSSDGGGSSRTSTYNVSGLHLDGVSHVAAIRSVVAQALDTASSSSSGDSTGSSSGGDDAMTGISADCPRKYLLYNAYTNIASEAFDTNTNANAAVRDSRYKLMHVYTGNRAADWYYPNTSWSPADAATAFVGRSTSRDYSRSKGSVGSSSGSSTSSSRRVRKTSGIQAVSSSGSGGSSDSSIMDIDDDDDDDDALSDLDTCHIYVAMQGTFTYLLFDLQDDPYETNNLYYDAEFETIRNTLSTVLDSFVSGARREEVGPTNASVPAFWTAHGSYVQPFTHTATASTSDTVNTKTYPVPCN